MNCVMCGHRFTEDEVTVCATYLGRTVLICDEGKCQ